MTSLETIKSTRSRVTNGNSILPHTDGRRHIAKRFRDIANAIVSDLGGLNQLSESKLQLIRRFSAAACLAEELESAFARGEPVDISQHSLLSSTLVRLATRIGLNRVAKTVGGLTLSDLWKADREKQQQQTAAERSGDEGNAHVA